MTTPPTTVREYGARARSTDVFGRVLCDARDHHFIVDGPVQNNCPGEEVTPAELFLSAVASCGVELMQVIAKESGFPVPRVGVHITGLVDRSRQRRETHTTFNTVRLDVTLEGVDREQATALVTGFQRRCPLFGTVAVASDEIIVEFELGPPRLN